MATASVPLSAILAALLDSPEVVTLIADLEVIRWTGRPGYPIRSMVGMALVKSLYNLPTWTRTARLVAENAELQRVLGTVPSVYACYRFTAKMLPENFDYVDLGELLDVIDASVDYSRAGTGHQEPGETRVLAARTRPLRALQVRLVTDVFHRSSYQSSKGLHR